LIVWREDRAGQVKPVPGALDEVADLLRPILKAVERGELTAPGPMVAHLQGALATVEALERTAAQPTVNPSTV